MSVPKDSIQITIHEWDRVKRGHDRYEFLRTCSLYQFTQIWQAAARGEVRFDDEVDRLRILEHGTSP